MSEQLRGILTDIIIGLGTGLLSTLTVFIISLAVFSRPRLVISRKITRDVNKSTFTKDGEVAWKFRIMNRSRISELYNVDVKLAGIRYERNADGTYTQHRKSIPCFAVVRKLSRYMPNRAIARRRRKDPRYTISFHYRPLTYDDLLASGQRSLTALS